MKMILKPLAFFFAACATLSAGELESKFLAPSASARPGVYWYFMDGNQDRDEMVADLEAMDKVGIGSVLFLEVDLGMPAGPIPFMSEKWQDNVVHAIKTTERLGMEFILGTGPGWAGSGGSWVKPEDSMQHLVGGEIQASGPSVLETKLPVPPPHSPNPFAGMSGEHSKIRDQWYQDVAVLAFPTPEEGNARFDSYDIKTLKDVNPYSIGFGNAVPFVIPQADYLEPPGAKVIDASRIIDLTSTMQADGSLRWDVPAGKWTVMRFVSRSTGQTTRPAPRAGHGFECDKFSFGAYRRHWESYQAPLIAKLGALPKGKGLTSIHLDSWEMSSQNWTAAFRDEFTKRRGYDPQPFFPAYMGMVVGSMEKTERFLWDMRKTSQELTLENHAGAIQKIAHNKGLSYSNEPYDMNPAGDIDLGSVADIPACEFWNVRGGPETQYSCIEAVSIAHIMGKQQVNAEAFTTDAAFGYLDYPGSMKNQTDWAFAMGINGLIFHTFQHQPLGKGEKPGMNMGPYGVQWHRNQTWWDLSSGYHQYIARCQEVLRQGEAVADVLYLTPEAAPNIFVAPKSATQGAARLQDKKGYNFDAVTPRILAMRAELQDGKIKFPGGSSYSVLVLPDVETMTPEALATISALVKSGATVIGNPPRKSPSLVGFPACDAQVQKAAEELWGATPQAERKFGKGRILLNPEAQSRAGFAEGVSLPDVGKWIWFDQGEPAASAAVANCRFRTTFDLADAKLLKSAVIQATADNSFMLEVNGHQVLQGDNFNNIASISVLPQLRSGKNTLSVLAVNGGDAPNPAGFIAALRLGFADGTSRLIESDQSWEASLDGTLWSAAKNLGKGAMAPWSLKKMKAEPEIYPSYAVTAAVLAAMGIPEDFQSDGPIRYGHRRTASEEIYFVSNTLAEKVSATCRFRVQEGAPQLWDAVTAKTRSLPAFTREGKITSIPIRFEANQSFFVIFPRGKAPVKKPVSAAKNFSEPQLITPLVGAWQVAFDPKWGGPERIQFDPLQDWTQNSERGIRYYSGTAIYRKRFDLPGIIKGMKLALDLGVVHDLCRVRLNGKDLGILWTAPWQVDVSDHLKAQGNELEIEVANRWGNRLIGDQQAEDKDARTLSWESGLLGGKPVKAGRYTFCTYKFFNADSPLQPSGLLGPVRILSTN